jgi:hypothetical protein
MHLRLDSLVPAKHSNDFSRLALAARIRSLVGVGQIGANLPPQRDHHRELRSVDFNVQEVEMGAEGAGNRDRQREIPRRMIVLLHPPPDRAVHVRVPARRP